MKLTFRRRGNWNPYVTQLYPVSMGDLYQRIAFLEVSTPANPILRWGHAIYFGHVVPRIGGLLSDRAAYRYLPKSAAYLPPGDGMTTMLRAAGFADADRRLLSGGITQLLTGTRS